MVGINCGMPSLFLIRMANRSPLAARITFTANGTGVNFTLIIGNRSNASLIQ